MKVPIAGQAAPAACGRAARRACCRACRGVAPRPCPPQPAGRARPRAQLFTLAVPNEKEDAKTTKVVLTRAGGVLDRTRSMPSPGWKRDGEQTRLRRGRTDRQRSPGRRRAAAASDEAVSSSSSAGADSADVHVPGRADATRTARSSTGPGRRAPTRPRRRVEAKSSLRRRRQLHARDRGARRRCARARARRRRAVSRSGRQRRAAHELRAGGRVLPALAALAVALALPAAASAHAVPRAHGAVGERDREHAARRGRC